MRCKYESKDRFQKGGKLSLAQARYSGLPFETFISSRILRGSGRGISRPIVTIATIAIAIGMALMILSIAILEGFQEEIRNKVIGFGSHIQVVSIGDNFSKESRRMLADQEFYHELKDHPDVEHIQRFAVRPGILESNEGLQGVVIKGVDQDYDWSFFEERLVRGEVMELFDDKRSNDIMLSAYQASRLGLDTGDLVMAYFVQGDSDIKPRPFRIKGLYATDMEEFDHSFVFVDIGHIQKLASWGLEAQIKKVENNGQLFVQALAFGGDGNYSYNWSVDDWKGKGPHNICSVTDSTVRLIVQDGNKTLPDTAWFSVQRLEDGLCALPYETTLTTSGGSGKYYCGGFEILLNDYDLLLDADDFVTKEIPFNLQTRIVTDQYPEIFNWLEMLDINVVIILWLMIFISVINMTSALLIIILERTRMIGLLKSMGAKGLSIVAIFMINAAYVIGIGVLAGNLLGIGLAWLQDKYALIKLDPVNYFVDTVPIKINIMEFVLLDIATVVICVIVLVLPALYVNHIKPIKAIPFD